MAFSKLRAYCSLPDMNKIGKNMENIFLKEISYGSFLSQKGFMTKNLRLFMLKKHLNRVGRRETLVF